VVAFFCLKSFSRVEFEIPPFGLLDCSFNLLFLAYHGIPVLVPERTTSLDVEVQCATCRYQTDEIKTILLDGWQSNRRHEKNSTWCNLGPLDNFRLAMQAKKETR
jgi:hypothetical protein